MTNEQREAIELAKEFTEIDFSNPMGWTGYYDTELKELSQAIDTVLSLIKENQKEIEGLKNINRNQSKDIKKAVDYTFELNKELDKKDKQIDLMAEEIIMTKPANCTRTNEFNTEKVYMSKEEIKQYFARFSRKGVEYGRIRKK